MESETIEFETSDGVVLTGDLLIPTEARAAVIVCHPHPQFGGNRFNPVVEALFTALAGIDVATLRFDFRGSFDDGRGERLDAEAALAEVRRRVPGVANLVVGYSFGAMIALALADDALAGKILVAPPLGDTTARPTEATPLLMITPAHDQFAPPDVAAPIVAEWPNAELELVESADHFLLGRAAFVADHAAAWVERRLIGLAEAD